MSKAKEILENLNKFNEEDNSLICPKCGAKWNLTEKFEDYFDEGSDADSLITSLAETPIDGEYSRTEFISCDNCDTDFTINMKFKKIGQTIEEFKG